MRLALVIVREVELSRSDSSDIVGRPNELVLDRLDPIDLLRTQARLKDLNDRVRSRFSRVGAVEWRSMRVDKDSKSVILLGPDFDGVDVDPSSFGGEVGDGQFRVRARVEVVEGEVVGTLLGDCRGVQVEYGWKPALTRLAV